MAAALTAPASVEVGEIISFSVAGATAAGELDFAIWSEEDDGGIGIGKAKFTASSGAFDSAGNLEVLANKEGHVHIKVTDVTAVTTDEAIVEVFTTG